MPRIEVVFHDLHGLDERDPKGKTGTKLQTGPHPWQSEGGGYPSQVLPGVRRGLPIADQKQRSIRREQEQA